ncbi:hypothetical protein [Methanosarcina barkeri]|nr:hypothetical protein [Methanosarcina barkeri]
MVGNRSWPGSISIIMLKEEASYGMDLTVPMWLKLHLLIAAILLQEDVSE